MAFALRPRFVDDYRPPIEIRPIQSGNRVRRLPVVCHFDKAKPARPPGHFILNDVDRGDLAILCKFIAQTFLARVVRQVPDIQFFHSDPPRRGEDTPAATGKRTSLPAQRAFGTKWITHVAFPRPAAATAVRPFRKFTLTSRAIFRIKVGMTIFDEEYKVVAVESQQLVIRGVLSGNVLVINTDPDFPREAFPVGQLITLSDPSAGAPN